MTPDVGVQERRGRPGHFMLRVGITLRCDLLVLGVWLCCVWPCLLNKEVLKLLPCFNHTELEVVLQIS